MLDLLADEVFLRCRCRLLASSSMRSECEGLRLGERDRRLYIAGERLLSRLSFRGRLGRSLVRDLLLEGDLRLRGRSFRGLRFGM